MGEQLIYFLGTLIVVDIMILMAGIVPYVFGAKTGCWWRKLLWLILAVRLLVPVRLLMTQVYEEKALYFVQIDLSAVQGMGGRLDENAHSLAQGTGEAGLSEQGQTTVSNKMDYEETVSARDTMSDTDFADAAALGMNRGSDSRWILLIIWGFGALALTVYHVLGFLRIRELIKAHSYCCTDLYTTGQVKKLCEEYRIRSVPRIFVCDRISSPMLFGYVHTRLLMPDKPYTETELYLILRHELQHRKSGDLWYKLLIMSVCDIYWFNPVLILMKRLAYQDVECVCDARVMRCLTAEEQKLYGNIVLNNMAGARERVIVYGTSIFTGKRAAKLRIKSMFTEKNKSGFIILGVLILCVAVGSSMWVLSGQDREDQTVQGAETGASGQNSALVNADRETEQDTSGTSADHETEQSTTRDSADRETGQDTDQSDTVRGPEQDGAVVNSTVIVENMEDISRAKDLNCVNCYTTNVVRGGNHYWIDEEGTLWGTGTSEYGQLKEVREDMSRITEPVEIARHVKHVDFSGEYFAIYLTEDNQLYGLGANPSSVLHLFTTEDYQHIIPEPVLVMENVIYAKCGHTAVIALTENGEVHIRGEMKYVPFSGGNSAKVMENAKYVTAYNNTYAVIDDNDSLWTWGDNSLGQCGVGYLSEQVQSPEKVMDGVECAWMGSVAFNSTDGTDARAQDNLIVLAKDGTFYGCGERIGTGEIIPVSLKEAE